MDFYFYFFIFPRSTFNLKSQKLLLKTIFGSLHKSNRIYLLWSCFSNYVQLTSGNSNLQGTKKK